MDLVEDAGITAPAAYTASFASVALSIGIWLLRRGEDRGNAERFGIFVGLWAPTLMILGKVLEDRQRVSGS